MMPKDTNAHGTIFGGVLLSYIDQAGAIAAARQASGKLVTVAMREVIFHHPVMVGDLLSLYAHITRVGRTSITTQVEVVVTRLMLDVPEEVQVTEAEVVYVTIDDECRPRAHGLSAGS